jgi:hypothetical protein
MITHNRPMADQTVESYFGLTPAQIARMPRYLFDSLGNALATIKSQHAKLENAKGLKPEDGWRASANEGIVVETDVGSYTFPFERRGAKDYRGTVTMNLPVVEGSFRRQVTLSFLGDESTDEVEILAGLNGCSIKPRASNVFILKLGD